MLPRSGAKRLVAGRGGDAVVGVVLGVVVVGIAVRVCMCCGLGVGWGWGLLEDWGSVGARVRKWGGVVM